MSRSLSNSPQAGEPGSAGEREARSAPAPAFEILARREWEGVEFLLCREDIHEKTRWSIAQPRNTVIVHLGGAMNTLDTEIEGVGATHAPPSPGDIWLVPAHWRYASQARGNVITYAELRVSPDAGVDMADGGKVAIECLSPRLGHRDEFLYYSVAQIGRMASHGDDLSEMMTNRLQLLVRQHLFRDYRLQSNGPPARRNGPVLGPDMARRIADYIEDRLDQRIGLNELAALAGFSVHQLLIAFRRSFDTTPAQYVLTQRLRRARWKLLNTLDDIGDIALACGFASHSHLSAAFKRQAGISPRQFREGLRTSRWP